MNLDVATLQLLILAIPGILWAMLESSLRGPTKSDQFVLALKILVYGLIAFSLAGVVYRTFNWRFDTFNFDKSLPFSDKVDEIIISIPIAILLAMASIANRTHCWTTGLLRYLKITNYSGTDDIWEYSLSLNGLNGEYVYVRDIPNDLVYFGYVEAYSDRNDLRELLLEDVAVYDSRSEPLYTLDRIYLSMDKECARIEFPSEIIKGRANGRSSANASTLALATTNASREGQRQFGEDDVTEPTGKTSSTSPNQKGLNVAKDEKTSKKAGSAASRVMKDKRTGKDSKTAAGSALTQRPNKKK